MVLATMIIVAWLCLHIYGVFFIDLQHPLVSLALVVALSWLSVGLFIVAHDAMHGSLWTADRKVGDMVGTLCLWLYAGFSFRELLPKHYSHHRHPGSSKDPDFAPDSPSRALVWYGRFMKTYFGWREAGIMMLRVAIYMLFGARLENILLFFALPGILSSFQLFYFGTFLPHRQSDNPDHPHFPDHHNARSNEFGYLASLLTCFHFGYHHEHHLRPGTPWWRLPATRQLLRNDDRA